MHNSYTFSWLLVSQIHVQRLAPGFVQQFQSRCDMCRGRGEIISGEIIGYPLIYTLHRDAYKFMYTCTWGR